MNSTGLIIHSPEWTGDIIPQIFFNKNREDFDRILLDSILNNSNKEINETIIDYNRVLLKKFESYFDPTFEPIPKYKKRDWIYNKNENEIPYFPMPDFWKKKRPSKYADDTDQSVKNANLGKFIDMAIAVIFDVWKREIEAMFGSVYFMRPDLAMYDGMVTHIRTWEGKVKEVLSPMFYMMSIDTIHISRDVLEIIDFHTSPESAIWLTLAIAHEFWHSLQWQFVLQMSKWQEEDFSDFVAWRTLRLLQDMWILWDNDILSALNFFSSIGTPVEQREWEKVHDTPEWRVAHLMRWYTANRNDVKREILKYRPTLINRNSKNGIDQSNRKSILPIPEYLQ